MVFGSYRKDDFADPDNFLIQLGMVLERYPDAIIRDATNPITGIQRQCKFPPSIAEVVEFCDELRRRANFTNEWDERSRKQLGERERWQSEQKTESTEHRRAVVERVKSELAKRGMNIMAEQEHGPTVSAESMKQKYGISDEVWNAIPDRPSPKRVA